MVPKLIKYVDHKWKETKVKNVSSIIYMVMYTMRHVTYILLQVNEYLYSFKRGVLYLHLNKGKNRKVHLI